MYPRCIPVVHCPEQLDKAINCKKPLNWCPKYCQYYFCNGYQQGGYGLNPIFTLWDFLSNRPFRGGMTIRKYNNFSHFLTSIGFDCSIHS